MNIERAWHEDAVVYALDVGTYQDSNGDGRGDFRGLIGRLPYLSQLGVTCLWILPFYPSPNHDNGYDITNYLDIEPELGTLDEFDEFITAAHFRGFRVLIDLVGHHTSDEHPWFQAARSGPDSCYRDYYVWSTEKPDGSQEESIFPGVEDGVWQFDQKAREFYHHRFYRFQPDLNVANRNVQCELLRIVDFWAGHGIDGIRIDALNHMFEEKGLPGTATEAPCNFIDELREVIAQHKPDAILLAEADVPVAEFQKYLCGGNGVDLYMNFPLNNYLFLALARQSAAPLLEGMRQLPDIPVTWLNYCRNLDELDLERLSDEERIDVYAAFAPDEEMRLYNRGVRRRLAPMLGRDSDRHRLALSVVFSLPGAQLLAYGDEIGMGDDLDRPERNSVRAPMQWTDAPHAGFSTAPGNPDVPPVISSGEFAFARVNVARQRSQVVSLLRFVEDLIRTRRAQPQFRSVHHCVLDLANDTVFAYRYVHEDGDLVAMHNFSAEPQVIPVAALPSPPVRQVFPGRNNWIASSKTVELGPYGLGWFQLQRESS